MAGTIAPIRGFATPVAPAVPAQAPLATTAQFNPFRHGKGGRLPMQPPASPPANVQGPNRETYTANNRELPDGALGKLVRREGQDPVGDAAVDQAHDNAGVVYDFFKQVLGRDSLDNKGMTLKSTVHFGSNFNNAYWNGESMTYGDGDGKRFAPLTAALDVVGHEMTHAVTERTAGLNYSFQSGALNESWSDVFGELIEQWHEHPSTFATTDGAKSADWMIGEDVFTPSTDGDALRSMKAPGTSHPGDPQPGHMRDFKRMGRFEDNGGVHYNSGIPNRAAYEAAVRVGSEKVAKIWYRALTDYMRPSAQFSDAANATVRAAQDLFKTEPDVAQAVTDAWTAVGVLGPNAIRIPSPSGLRGVITSPGRDPHDHLNPGIVPPWLTSPVPGPAPAPSPAPAHS